MGDFGLGLEDRAHQVRKLRVELQHLLELVEDQRGPLLALRTDLAGELEQLLDRVVDSGCAGAAGLEAEAQARVVGVDLDRRLDAKAAEERGRLLERLTDRRDEVVVDGLREGAREALLRRGLHQVAVGDEHALRKRLLGGPEHERGLAVSPGGEHQHVLAVPDVDRELFQLVLAVGKGLVECERAKVNGFVSLYISVLHKDL